MTMRKPIWMATGVAAVLSLQAPVKLTAQSAGSRVAAAFREMFETSQKDKKGIQVWVKGQSIGGAVTKILGDEAIEMRNQQYGKIVVRVDSIDAVAAN